jgi:hypothetical protein
MRRGIGIAFRNAVFFARTVSTMTPSDYEPARPARSGNIGADVESPAADPRAPDHDEWLLDEAIEETFPASDPPTPVRPGSSLSLRYARGAAGLRTRRRVLTRRASTAGIVLASALLFFLYRVVRRK